VNRANHYPLGASEITIWNRAIIVAKPSELDRELDATLKTPLTELVIQWTWKLALKDYELAGQMLVSTPTSVATAPSIYMMGRYRPQMPYSPMPYPYHMPLSMPASTSPTLSTRQALTPSPKAVIRLPIHQSSPIVPAEDPDLIMKAYIQFLSREYVYKADVLADAGRILGQNDLDINLLKEQSLSSLQNLGISLRISTYLLKHIQEFKAEHMKPAFTLPAWKSSSISAVQQPQHNTSFNSYIIDNTEQYMDQENIETQWDLQLLSAFEQDFIDIEEFEE
jgi:hypothetical protein